MTLGTLSECGALRECHSASCAFPHFVLMYHTRSHKYLPAMPCPYNTTQFTLNRGVHVGFRDPLDDSGQEKYGQQSASSRFWADQRPGCSTCVTEAGEKAPTKSHNLPCLRTGADPGFSRGQTTFRAARAYRRDFPQPIMASSSKQKIA